MNKLKMFFLILLLIMSVTFVGCSEKKTATIEVTPETQTVVLPHQKSVLKVVDLRISEQNSSLTLYKVVDYDDTEFVIVDDSDKYQVGDNLVTTKE